MNNNILYELSLPPLPSYDMDLLKHPRLDKEPLYRDAKMLL
jgi:hypothetical protein